MKYAAVLGCGTVGAGVAEILENSEVIKQRAGEDLALKYVLVRRMPEDSPFKGKMVTDFSVIENDPDVSLVAECIGGVGAALDYVRRALQAGKSVATSNKELVAKHGLELMAIAREKNASFLFEAAVGGGIPVLRPLSLCLSANAISEVSGIINGTTNYILTAMSQSGAAFDDALAEAQRLGYAEADPSADILGWDAGRKACILADLAYGKNVDPADIRTEGITGVTAEDSAAAEALGCAIKLLGRAVKVGEQAAVWVAPHLIDKNHTLSGLNGVLNGIAIKGDRVGETVLCGPGAGRYATASAVCGDLIEAAQREGKPRYSAWETADKSYLADPDSLAACWYVRCEAAREEAEALFPGAKFAPMEKGCAFLSAEMTGTELKAKAAALKPLSIFRVLF